MTRCIYANVKDVFLCAIIFEKTIVLIDAATTEILLRTVLALIMLSVGLSLTVADFKYLIERPLTLTLGLVLKIIVSPLIGLLVANLFGLPPVFQLGIFLLLICPGGTTTNIITYWFSGNIALTVSLTAIASFVSVVSVPLLLEWAHRFYFGDTVEVSLPVFETISNIFQVVLLPVLLGMALRWKYPKPATVAERIIKNISVVLLGLVYLIKFFASKEQGGAELTAHEIWTLMPALLVVNFIGMFMGFVLSKVMRINNQSSMTIGIEIGLANISLAIVVGSVLLHNEDLIKPGLIYAMFSFWTTTIFAFSVKKLFFKRHWE